MLPDNNPGNSAGQECRLSIRQIADRARVGKRHAEEAITSLLSRGLLNCKTRPGATAVYSLPAAWKGDSCPLEGRQSADERGANRTPVGGQLEVAGGQHLPPTGGQNCPPAGGQHLEPSEKLESSSRSSTVARPASRARGGTTTSPVESQPANPERWWTSEELQEARRAIAQHLGRGPVPDERVTSQVLVALRSMLEFRLWLGDLAQRVPGRRVRGWGFYVADANENWPTRQAEIEAAHGAYVERVAAQQRMTEAAEAEREGIQPTPSVPSTHVYPATTAEADATPSPPVEHHPVAELSIEDRRLLAEAKKTYRFASRDNLLEALPELRRQIPRSRGISGGCQPTERAVAIGIVGRCVGKRGEQSDGASEHQE